MKCHFLGPAYPPISQPPAYAIPRAWLSGLWLLYSL